MQEEQTVYRTESGGICVHQVFLGRADRAALLEAWRAWKDAERGEAEE